MEVERYTTEFINDTQEVNLLDHFPPVMVSSHHVMFVLTTYLALVKFFGPWVMKDRKPLDLKRTLLLYNSAQVLMNCYLIYLYTDIMGKSSIAFWGDVCRPASAANSYDPNIQPKILEAMYYYYVNKIIDLSDTVFFTLRKKQSQITCLHLFHHVSMVLSTWLSIIYIREEASVVFAGINSFVHVLMYSYYLVSCLGPSMSKFLWLKKYITSLQIIQFLVALSVLVGMKLINCKSNNYFWLLWTVNIAIFLALFLNFYIKSYMKKKKN